MSGDQNTKPTQGGKPGGLSKGLVSSRTIGANKPVDEKAADALMGHLYPTKPAVAQNGGDPEVRQPAETASQILVDKAEKAAPVDKFPWEGTLSARRAAFPLNMPDGLRELLDWMAGTTYGETKTSIIQRALIVELQKMVDERKINFDVSTLLDK